VPSIDAETYLNTRLDEQLNWLSKASRISKRWFLRLRILEILLGTAITILSPFASRLPLGLGSFAIALAGGAIAVSGSMLALNRHQENWLRYRSLAEALKREKYLFLTASPPYDDPATAFHRLVNTSEALLGAESSLWSRQMHEPSQPGAPAQGNTRSS
jgi:hypothetical protein